MRRHTHGDVEARWHELDRNGTRLACMDFGGNGSPVMLLHGLAGHATEWAQTAAWLTARHRVLAPDLRGHGRSERRPSDVSRSAAVDDIAAWIEHFSTRPVALVGQSLGGHTAFLVAACRPDLVDKLVVAEAEPGPYSGSRDLAGNGEVVEGVRQWLASWPVPFASREAAVAFFGRNENWAHAWADGLEMRADGLHPSFEVDVMTEMLRAAGGSYWDEWRRITCPVLLVVANDRENPAFAHRMLREQSRAALVEIPQAGHDLHLDNPNAWREALEAFL
jgi:pimeloyl-ACP methyl ester carboxylesterase